MSDITTTNHEYLVSVLEKSRTKLLDTSRRNRLLNFKETARDIAIIDEMPNQVFDHLAIQGNEFFFYSYDAEEDEDLAEIERTLPDSIENSEEEKYSDNFLQTPYPYSELDRKIRKLYYDHKSIIEETGANNLYIACGFLEWSEVVGETRHYRSPLVLVPVHLEKHTGYSDIDFKLVFDDEALDTNYSLLEKLKKDFDIDLPTLEDEQYPEDYWSKVQHAVSRKNHDDWNIVHEMSLGLFRFSKQVMWHDLDPKRWPAHSSILDKSVIKRIFIGNEEDSGFSGQITTEYAQDQETDGETLVQLPIILDADSSQYSALIDSINLEDGLVIEGPPGTGKSQTIANLIGVALDQGLSVLFVAEKMAALNVVYSRLENIGLGDFCLQLHGLKTSKKDLLSSLKDRIDLSIHTQLDLHQVERDLELTKSELIEFSTIISERIGPEELPLYAIPWLIEKLKQNLPDKFEFRHITNIGELSYEQFQSISNLFDDLGKDWCSIPAEVRQSWNGFMPNSYKEKNADVINDLFEKSIQNLKQILEWLENNSLNDFAPDFYETIKLVKLGDLNKISDMPDLPHGLEISYIHEIIHKELFDEFSISIKKVNSYLGDVKVINSVFDYASYESDTYASNLNDYGSLLSDVCCDSKTKIEDLKNEHSYINDVINAIDSLQEFCKPVTEINDKILRTLDDYEKSLIEIKKLTDGPPSLSLYGYEFHAKPTVNNYFELARTEYKTLVDKKTKLKLFKFDNNLKTEELKDDVAIISDNLDSWFSIFNKDYRKSKKNIKKILVDKKTFKKEDLFIEKLNEVIDCCCQRDSFNNHAEYKQSLGGLFQGVSTDWKKLNEIIKFSINLRECYGLEKAKKIIGDWDTHIDLMLSADESIRKSIETIKKYAATHPFPKSLWQRPVNEISRTLKPWDNKLESTIDVLLQPWCKQDITLSYAITISNKYSEVKRKEISIEDDSNFNSLLQQYWEKSNTNIKLLESLNIWFKERLMKEPINASLLKYVIPDTNDYRFDRFRELIGQAANVKKNIEEQNSALSKYGDINIINWLGDGEKINDLINKLQFAKQNIRYLPLMTRWSSLDKQVQDKGLGFLSSQIADGLLTESNSKTAFQYCYYSSLLTNKVNANESLKSFNETTYESLRKRFADYDHQVLTLNSKKIAKKLCNANVPEGVGHGRVAEYSEKRLIQHEAGKKARHIPIRQLLNRAPNAIKSLKPCFLMSPLSVSQYLEPGKIEFDILIMDEASQLRPEDSMSAVARANKCIIVGDPKQLPPTSFFDTVSNDYESDEESILDDTESILDVCLKQFPFRRLRWHYRSQHESLIQFSNQNFYNDDLIVFPSPRGDARDFGVHYTFVEEPNYKTGKNRAEAELVVENIVHHFHRHKNRSLGVVAFNKRQAEEIQYLLDKRRKTEPAVDQLISNKIDEPLFIKNLENVQGDERDVIFISTTYGPEVRDGVVYQRFGPINSDLGWRRLNVIATRAKQRVEVFSSLRPTDIHIGENSKRGARALRDYLEYASTGKISEHGTNTFKEPDSDFEIAVMNIINNLGYECTPQVGVAGFFIDIGVRHPDRPGEYLLGVECDGAAYHSAISVRDRDRLRQKILEDKGWYIHRIWSTSWFQSRNIEIDKLSNILKKYLDEERLESREIPQNNLDDEILSNTEHTSELELEKEEEILEESLENALERFWTINIYPYYKDRDKSILSEKMITCLVNRHPDTEEDWYNFVPIELRQNMNPEEKEYLPDILDIVMEYI
jgi:superfamily I DNA and/or RNA helicase/very-short-patch-repair endonuclease